MGRADCGNEFSDSLGGVDMKTIRNIKQRYGVLISPCILSPGLQAEKKQGRHWGYPFVESVMEYGVDMIPLPCPESAFGGFQSGLQRGKHGIDYYMSLEGYHNHCSVLAKQTVEMILDMQAGGYRFICMLGVEHSPTCAVSYMYSHHGMLKRPGMFYELLDSELKLQDVGIPQIGINRTHPKKALALLEKELSGKVRL